MSKRKGQNRGPPRSTKPTQGSSAQESGALQIALESAGIKAGKEGPAGPERKGIRLPAPASGNKLSISGRHSSTPGNEDQLKKEQQKWRIAQTDSGDPRVAVRPRAQQDSHRTAAYPPLDSFPMGKDPRTRTQFGGGPFEEDRVLVIGLDFGTSCTKVVIRDAILGTAYAVDFGNLGVSGNRYLLPSRIFCSTDGRLNLHNGEHKFVGYKLHLMNHADNPILEEPTKNLSASPKEITAGFIALTLQSARNWFLKNHGDNYARSRIIWQVNVGVPTGRISSGLHKIFYRAAYAGWLVSVDEGNVDLQCIKTASERVEGLIENQPAKHFSLKHDCEIHPEDVATVPEVIAQVIGYTRSPMRQRSMHLLVDVGASTLDVATFILHEREGEDLYPILGSEVQILGAFQLHQFRVDRVAKRIERKLTDLLDKADPAAPLPEGTDYVAGLEPDSMDQTDNSFCANCAGLLTKLLRETRTNHVPNQSVWEQGLPVFVCGGGSRIELYKEAVHRTQRSLTNVAPFKFVDLPMPDALEAPGLSPTEYHRLSVAVWSQLS